MKNRKHIRLKEYDYSQNGAYFVTICTHNRANILGKIIVGEGFHPLPEIKLTNIGLEIKKSIEFINNNYKNVIIDKYIIMPNHIHMIIFLGYDNAGGHGNPPLHNIVGQFKSYTTGKYGAKLWQRSFYDHIIRDENDYLRIWDYIDTNPLKWSSDEYYS